MATLFDREFGTIAAARVAARTEGWRPDDITDWAPAGMGPGRPPHPPGTRRPRPLLGRGPVSTEETVHYFSNGTEGYAWMDRNCDRCVHDHINHRPDADNPGCPHILSLYVGTPDPVFIPEMATYTDRHGVEREYRETWTCIEFSRCPCDRGPDDPGEPAAPTPDPNQGVLFDVDALTPGVWRDVVLDTFATEDVHA